MTPRTMALVICLLLAVVAALRCQLDPRAAAAARWLTMMTMVADVLLLAVLWRLWSE